MFFFLVSIYFLCYGLARFVCDDVPGTPAFHLLYV